jgi:hypothetical protein
MPVVHIEYDRNIVSDDDMQILSKGIHEVASKVTGIEDVPVYANSSHITYAISPIEVFIRLSDHKIKDLDALTNQLKAALSEWRTEQNYPHKINMSLIAMSWKIEIGI